MRNHYRALRDKLLLALRQSPLAGRVKISEEHAGLHFLLELDTQRSDEEILQAAQARTCGSPSCPNIMLPPRTAVLMCW